MKNWFLKLMHKRLWFKFSFQLLVKHKKRIKIDFAILYCMVWNRSAEWHALMQFYTVMASWLGVTVLLLLCFLPGRGFNSSEHQWDDRGYLIFCLCMGMSSVHFMHAMLRKEKQTKSEMWIFKALKSLLFKSEIHVSLLKSKWIFYYRSTWICRHKCLCVTNGN